MRMKYVPQPFFDEAGRNIGELPFFCLPSLGEKTPDDFFDIISDDYGGKSKF